MVLVKYPNLNTQGLYTQYRSSMCRLIRFQDSFSDFFSGSGWSNTVWFLCWSFFLGCSDKLHQQMGNLSFLLVVICSGWAIEFASAKCVSYLCQGSKVEVEKPTFFPLPVVLRFPLLFSFVSCLMVFLSM